MKELTIPPIIIVITLLFTLSCAEPVCIGYEDVEGREASLCDVCLRFETFADETVEVEGIIDDDHLKSKRGECSLAIFAVGFAVPESLIGGKARCVGTVFYQEESDEPGLSVIGMRARPPKRR